MKESKYCLNEEIIQHASRARRWEIAFLVALIAFVVLNLVLLQRESHYAQLAIVQSNLETDAQTAELNSILQMTSYLDFERTSRQLAQLKSVRASKIRFEQNKILLYYEALSISEIDSDIGKLKELFEEVRVLQLEQQQEESRIVIEVTI